jgi:hypothetical protein
VLKRKKELVGGGASWLAQAVLGSPVCFFQEDTWHLLTFTFKFQAKTFQELFGVFYLLIKT